MNLYDEIIEFETLVRKMKYDKSKYSGVKGNFNSKNREDYKNIPQDLKFTKNKTLELIFNEPVMLASENLKCWSTNVSTLTTLLEN